MFQVIYLYYVTGDLGWLYFQWGSFFYSVIQGGPKMQHRILEISRCIQATDSGQKRGFFFISIYIRAVPAKLAVF